MIDDSRVIAAQCSGKSSPLLSVWAQAWLWIIQVYSGSLILTIKLFCNLRSLSWQELLLTSTTFKSRGHINMKAKTFKPNKGILCLLNCRYSREWSASQQFAAVVNQTNSSKWELFLPIRVLPCLGLKCVVCEISVQGIDLFVLC